MPRRFGFGLGFNLSRLTGLLREPSGFVAKYQSYDVNDFTLVTGSNVSQWDDRTTQTFGSEIFTNPPDVVNGFTDNGDGSYTVSSATGSQDRLIMSNVIQDLKSYQCTITIDSISAGQINFAVGGDGSPVYTSAGTYTSIVTRNGGGGNLNVYGSTDFVGTVSNISVKEILTGANHLTQGTSADQPVLTQDVNQFNNTVDFGTDDYMEGLPTQSGDFTYVFKGVEIADNLEQGFLSDGVSSNFRLNSFSNLIQTSLGGAESTLGTFTGTSFNSVTFKREGTTISAYIDGVLAGTPVTNSGNFVASRLMHNGTGLDGSLQELYVYDRALTQDEINWFSYLRDSNNNISPLPPILPS